MSKRVCSVILAILLVFSMSSVAFAFSDDNQIRNIISETYQIPLNIVQEMDDEAILILSEGIMDKKVVSSSEKYVKFTVDENGNSIATEGTYQEYLIDTLTRDTEDKDWMRFNTTIVEIDKTTAEISCAYTWLTRPNLRMRDVMGLAVTQGTVIDNSAYGYYRYTTAQGNTQTNFTSGFSYDGHGVTRAFTLEKPDYPVEGDFSFIRAKIYKEGASEGLHGSYAHQRLSIDFVPGFSIDRNGIISVVGINFGLNYDQEGGYTSALWKIK